jgi:hypothetical protein
MSGLIKLSRQLAVQNDDDQSRLSGVGNEAAIMILTKTAVIWTAGSALAAAVLRTMLDGVYTTKAFGQNIAGSIMGIGISLVVAVKYPVIHSDVVFLVITTGFICNLTTPILRILLHRAATVKISAKVAGMEIESQGELQHEPQRNPRVDHRGL